MSFRPYQAKLQRGVHDAWNAGARAVVLQAATGAGKTHMAAGMIETWREPTLFLAHLDALVTDTAKRLRAAGMSCGVIAPWAPSEPQHMMQIGSLGTIHARGLRPNAKRVVLDECHRSEAPSVKDILRDYPGARILGLTATPQRGDGAPLDATWDAMVCGPSIAELTALGAIVPSDLRCPPKGRGDAVSELRRLVPGWRAIVFAEDMESGNATAGKLTAAGYRVAEMYAKTPRAKREDMREALRAGDLDALIGVGVFVEGFDESSVDVVVLDAAFGTVGRYLQAIGRGLRPHPGKNRCIVLDVRGAVHTHGLPDEDRKWRLSGTAAVIRTAPGLRLSRCPACWAVFRTCAACPRCGAPVGAVTDTVERTPPTKAEKLEVYASIPVDRRREAYFHRMVSVGMQRRRMSRERAVTWARTEAEKRFP